MAQKQSLSKTDTVYSRHIIPQPEAAVPDSISADLPSTSLPSSSILSEHKIALCLNTKFKGKYHGPNWGEFNDSFKRVNVDAYKHAQAIRSGYATSPVIHGRRKKENFVSAQHIGLDFDTEDDHARLNILEGDPFIARYGAIIHTSASHTEEKPRARVFFYLDRAVDDPDQYRRYAAALLKKFALADQKAKDPARMFFGAENCEVRIINEGHNRLPLSILDSLADELLPPARTAPLTPTRLPHSKDAHNRGCRWASKKAEGTLADLAGITQGGRNDALNKAAYKLGQLVAVGLLTHADIEQALIHAGQSIGLSEYEATATVRSGLNCGEKIIPDWIPNFDTPPQVWENAPSRKPFEAQVVQRFSGETLNYYPEGIPLTVIELLNGLHRNPWVHIAQGDIPNFRSFVALWVLWHERVIAGEQDPIQPISMADLTRLTGMTKDVIRNALNAGEYGGFLSPYKNIDNRGKESHQNTRGKPPQYYVFRSLENAWDSFMTRMRPSMWRALLINEYPELPAEAAAIADLLPTPAISDGDIALLDNISYSLYGQYADGIVQATEYFYWREDTWLNRYIFPADTTPLRLPEGSSFANAAEFGDLLNKLDMIEHKGERKGKDRYRIAKLTGRTLAAHRSSNKRLGISNIPDWDEYPVKENVDILTQCRNISQVAYERGNIRICAPNGKITWVSPNRRRFNYDRWLENNGGYDTAIIQVWERNKEKSDSLLTKEERAMRADYSKHQAAISALRPARTSSRTSAATQWLIAQGEMRAKLFGIERIKNLERPSHMIYIGPQGDVFEPDHIWVGIIQATRLELNGGQYSVEYVFPDYVLTDGKTVSSSQYSLPEYPLMATRRIIQGE